MTTLENSYCKPKTEAEWSMLGIDKPETPQHGTGVKSSTGSEPWLVSDNAQFLWREIPVQHFLDLLNDSIVPWRLEEAGFTLYGGRVPYYEKQVGRVTNISWAESTAKYGVALSIEDGDTWLNIQTFTDLLILIRFLSPP